MKVFRLFTLFLALALGIPAVANITSQVNRAGPYTCTVLPATVSVVFPFQQSSDILVLNLGQSGTSIDPPTVLTLNSDYTVTGGGYNPTTNMQSGNVVVVTGGAHNVQVNDRVVILRNVPINQLTSLTSGVLTAAAIEKALDKQATLSQQGAEVISRSLRFQPGELIDGTLNRTARSSKVLGFDSSGNISYYAFVAGAIVPQSIQGTANQVLVNGSSGTPVTGAATLTLPQSIATTNTVQFGKVGIGTPAIANSDLFISRSLPSSTAQASVTVTGSLNPGVGVDLHPNSFRDTSSFVPVVAGDAYASYDAQATVAGAVPLNHYHGYQARSGYIGTGTLDIMSGFATTNMGLSGLGTITFMRGLYVSNPTIGGGGTVGQYDGIYMDNLTNSTGNVNAIYIAGNNRVFMGGGQLVTSIDLTPPAGATTARGAFTFDQATQTGLAVMNRNATATGTMISFCRDGGSVQGSVTQVNNTTVAYNTSSDSRLKKNVRAFPNSGAMIDRMKPRLFDWLSGEKDSHGFIAQELYEVYPEAVSKGGADPKMQPWQVDYSKLTPVLTAEVKDLRRRVAQVELKVVHLEITAGVLCFLVSLQSFFLFFRNRKSA